MAKLTVALIRVGMVLCSAILLANTADILRLRRSTKTPSEIIEAVVSDLPFKISRDVITQGYYRITSSRWLGVHVWPVLPWLLLAYLQTSSYVRKNYLQWHRRFGRIYLVISVIMTIGYMMMFVDGETIIGDDEFYIDFRRPEKFFTFRAACLTFTVWWIYCMINVYRTASEETKLIHRYWAYQFLATGFGVGSMRLYLVTYIAIRYPLSGLEYMPKSVEDVLMGYSLWAGFVMNCLVAHFLTRVRQPSGKHA